MVEIRRRGFLGSMIGAALAPDLILKAMPEPARAAVLAPLQGAIEVIENEFVLPVGFIYEIALRGIADVERPAVCHAHRANGERLLAMTFNTRSGVARWSSLSNSLVSTPEQPILISTDADVDGHILFADAETSTARLARIKGGKIVSLVCSH